MVGVLTDIYGTRVVGAYRKPWKLVGGRRRPGIGPFITAFLHERNRLERMDTEEGTNDSLRPEQKEILDGFC